MLKKFAPFALAAAVAVTLAGCPETNDRVDMGGGGGTETDTNVVENRDMNTDTPAERAGDQLALDWGTNLTGDKRNVAEGFTRAAWVQSNLAAGEWEQAGEDLESIEEQIQDLTTSENIPANVRSQVAALQPMVNELGTQIVNRDRNALLTSNKLVDQYSTMLSDQNTIAWMSENRGGGAGTGTMDDDRDMLHNENRDRNVNP